jgi:hypothetical protein
MGCLQVNDNTFKFTISVRTVAVMLLLRTNARINTAPLCCYSQHSLLNVDRLVKEQPCFRLKQALNDYEVTAQGYYDLCALSNYLLMIYATPLGTTYCVIW